jgi:hypothetical protein
MHAFELSQGQGFKSLWSLATYFSLCLKCKNMSQEFILSRMLYHFSVSYSEQQPKTEYKIHNVNSFEAQNGTFDHAIQI